MDRSSDRFTNRVRVGAGVLALVTALTHLYLFLVKGFVGSGSMLPIYQLLFFVNFLVYTVLAAPLFSPALARYYRLVRVLLIAVAVASFASYLYVGVFEPLGTVDKIIEVLLIALLTVDAGILGRNARDAGLQLAVGALAGLVLFFVLTLVMV